ncbi:hypothetical protein K435DRAFT_973513 [Dendrothele bispora CBS 962.96]|uniref:Prolyl 4-hydroxylase alpha subunit Fe(2+) 2OG dioxygenase domain-containing protein n=1 Tax=Dendrothele bispora (strain CBS 962.96) TaxID=1314807 RepID=A0A4S8KS70_DENBC|nr:hypothetical protein K435DRAFT_973513 [Dendrothele bispora CBS 962.96]
MSLKRSGSDSLNEALDVKKSRSDASTVEDPTVVTEDSDSETIPHSEVPGLFSTALKIQDAIDSYKPVIGFCPLRDECRNENVKYHYIVSGHGYDIEYGDPVSRKVKKEDLKQILEFQQIAQQKGQVYQKGYLDASFSLKITLPDYTFEQDIPIRRVNPYVCSSGASKTDVQERLETWFRHGTPSGYGDLREHSTKFDDEVRSAREVSAENFHVDSAFLREVENHWKNHFYPTNVRAEPYKIHMYGEGGKFEEHRDTPQAGLVGTFLVGLGDTTWSRHLVVDGNECDASEGSWVAFYPDVPHEVTRIRRGYRAVLALKIFRDDTQVPFNDELSSARDPMLTAAANQLVTNLELPYGFILDRKYCLGTTKLSGIDAIVYSRARKLPHILHPVIIPILIRTRYFQGYHRTKDGHDDVQQTITYVEPFTSELIHAQRDSPLYQRWETLKEIPFYDLRAPLEEKYSYSPEHSSVVWSSSSEEINYLGNESDGERGDGIYMSYAVLCLPPDFEVQTLFKID